MIHSFAETYSDLLYRLLTSGVEEMNQRTGRKIKALPGFSFQLDLRDRNLPTCGIRRTYPKMAAVELAWFLTGSKCPELLHKYGNKFWDKFLEEDGSVAGAYGFRWRSHFGRDQLFRAMLALRENPSDRRIFVSAWDPALDGLGSLNQKNVPCPVGFTLSVLDGRLNSTLLIRSSDVFVGLPYDVMGHAMLMAMYAEKLGVMQVTLAHPHLYEAHYQMASEAIDRCSDQGFLTNLKVPTLPLSSLSISDFMVDPDGPEELINYYTQEQKRTAEANGWPTFSPKPELIA